MKNYYEILEVNPKATDEIIKKVYKIKVKQNHPDLFQGDEKIKAEEITKEITEAYDVLSNKEKRQEYDLGLKNEEDSEKYKKIISSLEDENMYLKQIITSKNNMINDFLNTNSNIVQNNNNILNETAYNENYPDSNMQSTKSDNRSYFTSVIFDLKQFFFKISILIVLIICLLILFWLLTGNNVFRIITDVL